MLLLAAAAFVAVAPGPARAAGLATHAPIVIASNADFTAANGVTGGSGTWFDPYVIEGWDIDASASAGILIENTNASFVIQNVSVHGGGATYDGIDLQNVSNAVVSAVNASMDWQGLFISGATNVSVAGGQFSYDGGFGIVALGVTGLRVTGATVYRGQNSGITVLQSSRIEVSGNVVTGDPAGVYSQEGIGISGVTDGVVSHNVVSEFNNDGIGIGTSAHVLAYQNLLSNNYWAMQFHQNTNSYVINNTFVSNYYGVLAYQDTSVNITENYFGDNSVALYLENMDTTMVAYNRFVGNGRGIWQLDSVSSDIFGNVMLGDGLTILGSTQAAFDSHRITPDNTVDGLPILYIKGVAGYSLNGASVGEVIVVDSIGVQLTNLTIVDTDAPIEVAYSTNVNVTSCVIQNDWLSVFFEHATGGGILGNTVSGVAYGIEILDSQGVQVRGNTISAARYGMYLGTSDGLSILGNSIDSAGIAGIAVASDTNPVLEWNNLTGNAVGINVTASSGVQIHLNTIASSGTGLVIMGSAPVNVTYNDFESNGLQASVDAGSTVTWNGAWWSGGNHWSDYTGVDHCTGPAQNVCTGPDGIGDTPYVIDASNQDQYPLMVPVHAVPPVPSFSVTPTVGGAGAVFVVDASSSYDPMSAGFGLLYRWDWNGDGIYDTPWSSYPLGAHIYGADGTYTIRLEVMSIAGRTATTAHQVVFDTTPPTTIAFLSGTPGNSPWFVSAVTVTLSATDSNSGVRSTQYRVDGGAWTPYAGPFMIASDGTHVLEFSSTDRAGNVEVVKSVAIDIDTVPPTVSASLAATQVKPHWYRSPVMVTLTASDVTSGTAVILYRVDGGSWQIYNGPFVVSAAGTHVLEFQATDYAGNTSSIQSVTFTIKK